MGMWQELTSFLDGVFGTENVQIAARRAIIIVFLTTAYLWLRAQIRKPGGSSAWYEREIDQLSKRISKETELCAELKGVRDGLSSHIAFLEKELERQHYRPKKEGKYNWELPETGNSIQN
jgi:hypothetical protein